MKQNQPLVTCIIPVYNAEKYLDQGVRSLLRQTYDNVEIILVDDRSTDSSWEICKKYTKENANVLAFRNDHNSGAPLRARERGIHESHGEWITFMDCDDYVMPQYIEHLVEATNDGKYDIAVTGHSRLYPDGRLEDFVWKNYTQTTEQRLAAFYQHFLTHDFWTDPTDTVGQNLIRASICKKTDLSKYSNLLYAEDTLMALAFLANSKSGINFVGEHDFIWRQVEGSGSHGGFSSHANQAEFFDSCLDIFHASDTYDNISQECPLVSIVIPVYNVEQYLVECLESVVNQTYKKLEIIIVNDGTEDQSQKIIDEYRKKDHRVVAIRQENQGLNMARAAGSKVARGQYIAFVDSDDMVHKDYIQIMYENLLQNDVDISICGFQEFTESTEVHGSEKLKPDYSEQAVKDKKELISYFFGQVPIVPNVHQMTAWGKLYKANIIRKTDWHLSNYRRHEDNLEALQWYRMADKGVATLSTQLYYYRKNPGSITNKLQQNVGPDNRAMNYFEFIDELYEKNKKIVNDPSLDIVMLNNFAHTNRLQVQSFFSNKQLDDQNMNSATDNWDKLIGIYNQCIKTKDEIIQQQAVALNDIRSSTSWRITKPIRFVKRLVLNRTR